MDMTCGLQYYKHLMWSLASQHQTTEDKRLTQHRHGDPAPDTRSLLIRNFPTFVHVCVKLCFNLIGKILVYLELATDIVFRNLPNALGD